MAKGKVVRRAGGPPKVKVGKPTKPGARGVGPHTGGARGAGPNTGGARPAGGGK